MKYLIIGTAATMLVVSSVVCCGALQLPSIRVPQIEIPDIDIELPEIRIPTIEVGEIIEEHQEVAVDGANQADVRIVFGAGDLEVDAGDPGTLFAADFRYNIAEWAPEVGYDVDDHALLVKQGGDENSWGIPSDGNIRNEWDVTLSPSIPISMSLLLGAGRGDMDFTGMQIARLDMDMGAGDFAVRFNQPAQIPMSQMTVRTGASRLEIEGIGNVSPERVVVQGGAGDITLDLTGNWQRSADVNVTAGVGQITLLVPRGVSVRIGIDGLATIDNDGLEKRGDDYVSDAYGDTEDEINVSITAGIGNIRLEQTGE